MWLSVEGSEVESYRVQPVVRDDYGSHASICIPRICCGSSIAPGFLSARWKTDMSRQRN